MSEDLQRRLVQLKAAFESGAIDADTYRLAVTALTGQMNAEAAVFGGGAVAQGTGAMAAGVGGVVVGGNVSGDVVTGGQKTQVDTGGGSYIDLKLTRNVSIVKVAPPLSKEERLELEGLQILKGKIKVFWIDGVLEGATRGARLIELDKQTRTDAIDHPWETVLELPELPSQRLAHDTRMVDVFE